MIELLPLLASAFILGLMGAGHCLGMCGGLMGALTLALPAAQRQRRMTLMLAYNVGRVASYGCAGLVLGLAGWALGNGPALLAMRLVAALLLIAMGLYLAGWWHGLTRIESLGKGLWRWLRPLTTGLLPPSSVPRALLLGALWGWLPCGLVYSTLLWAASQADASTSGLLMLAFGIGTWPVLILTGLTAERATTMLRKRGVRIAGGVMVIGFGLWTVPWPGGHPGHCVFTFCSKEHSAIDHSSMNDRHPRPKLLRNSNAMS